MDLRVGERVDEYVVEGRLGEGSSAVVYRVRDAGLGRVWALKVLYGRDPALRARLLREGRVLSMLRHPNVVEVVRLLEVRRAPALLIEFVAGPPLSSLTGAPLPPDEAIRLVRAIASGVAAAHALGVVHRDLRPQNVLLADTGGPVVPKVADFGVASVQAPGGLTVSGASIGNPAYTATEQLRDPRAATPAADVYSLGVILYELLTGDVPGGARDIPSAVRTRAAPPELSRIPEALRGSLARCLSEVPGQRPPDAAAFLEGLPDASAPPRRAEVLILVTDGEGRGRLVPLLVDLVPGSGIHAPAGTSPGVTRAAEVAILAALGPHTNGTCVRWALLDPRPDLDGGSLGLGLAVAVRAARAGRAPPAGSAYTGAVDLHGRVHPVAGIPAKVRAASDAGVRAVVPAGNAADAPSATAVATIDEVT